MSIARWLLSGVLLALAAQVGADDSPRYFKGGAGTDMAAFVTENCVACHAVKPVGDGPRHSAATRAESGPPLYYVGDKYREEWLREWLQAPERIRPAGYYPSANVRASPEGDAIDETSLVSHPILDAELAEEVAGYLMTLTPYADRLAQEEYEPASVPLRMARLDFRRFKGCVACHQDVKGEGGVSGPELYSAWSRLQPQFIVSFVRSPGQWNPDTMMPVLEMNDAAIHRLANYLKTIAEE
jgi:mono/diheme cytochrome c family protein